MHKKAMGPACMTLHSFTVPWVSIPGFSGLRAGCCGAAQEGHSACLHDHTQFQIRGFQFNWVATGLHRKAMMPACMTIHSFRVPGFSVSEFSELPARCRGAAHESHSACMQGVMQYGSWFLCKERTSGACVQYIKGAGNASIRYIADRHALS